MTGWCLFVCLVERLGYLCSARESARWLSRVRDRIELYDKGTPHARHGKWREAFQTSSYRRFFDPPEEVTFNYKLSRTAEKVIDRALSSSYVSAFPETEKAKIEEDVAEIIRQREDMVWIDESRGMFEYPLKTILITSRRK
jgi:hypothetical protein